MSGPSVAETCAIKLKLHRSFTRIQEARRPTPLPARRNAGSDDYGHYMGRAASDEFYVLDLCDQILAEDGLRQHRFDWLLGDPGASGRRVRLPVDGYWPNANIVVEYRERQHDQPLNHFDKPDRLTVSGVHRGLQRALYDARRDELIPAHGIRLVIITPADLDATPRGRLRRHPEHDLPAIKRLLLSPADPSAIPQAPAAD